LERLVVTLIAVALCAGPIGCGTTLAQQSQQPLGEQQVPFRFFSPSSFWNRPLKAEAPLDPRSSALVGALVGAVESERVAGTGPWINTNAFSLPVYTVAAEQPDVKVQLAGARREPRLSRAWRSVPLPADARPAAGSDGDLLLWQPSTDRLWEFWRLRRNGSTWQASWGGAMRNVSAQSGVFGRKVWPGGQRSWGTSASSLSLAGGLISLAQLRDGEIDHALEIAVPEPRAEVFADPAQRTDGASSSPLALPEGAHLRLDPGLNLDSLGLPALTLMLARAAQRYGIVVVDRSPNVALYAEDPSPTGTDPYTAPGGFFGGPDPRAALAAFPWSRLQLLRMRLRHPR
jgi:hypothetical protein